MTRWKMAPRTLAAAFAGALAAGNAGCQQLECGEGTLEVDGECRPAQDQPGNAQCGAGTVLGSDGKCEIEVQVDCDPETTREEIDPVTGDVTCVGLGGGLPACTEEINCGPPSDSMHITICGRLYDTQTDLPISDAGTPTECDPDAPTATGICSLEVYFVDALLFAMNPSGTPATEPEGGFYLDSCGRFRGVDLPKASFGFTGIAVDDADGQGDRFKLTGVALDDDDAAPARGFHGYATRNETDVAWSTSAAIGGTSFATRGVLAAVFRYRDAPRPGVVIRREGQMIPADDFYFSDTNAQRNTVMSSLTQTGANGTALAINSPAPQFHDGVGAEPSGCRWPNSLAASIMGVVFVQLKDAEGTGGAGAECP